MRKTDRRNIIKKREARTLSIFVGIIGPNKKSCTNEIYTFGLKLGKK